MTVISLRRWIESAMAERIRGFPLACYLAIMRVPSLFYQVALHIRHFLYDQKVFRVHKVEAFVISVGNLLVGGTGKTQLALAIAQRWQKKKKVALLTRGYPLYRGAPSPVTKEGGAEIYGDEAQLLFERLPEVMVIVGRNRVAAAKLAVEKGAELIIVDDGMQHRRLFRNLDILLGPTEGRFLPQGRLRDLPARQKKADLVLEPSDLHIEVEGVFTCEGKRRENLPKKVALFCGIGRPESFVKTVQSLGCEIVKTLFLADHEKIQESELQDLMKSAELVLCTEKDRVKLPSHVSPQVAWVKTRVEVEEKFWQAIEEKVSA